jgi:hypothetical protein
VRDPQQALDAARRAAAEKQPSQSMAEDTWTLEDPSRSSRRLVEWAIIEPDQARIYSTRRYGQPLTWLKRALVRFLRQYFDQVTAQQSRFNAQLASHVLRLEERVAALEGREEGASRLGADGGPGEGGGDLPAR